MEECYPCWWLSMSMSAEICRLSCPLDAQGSRTSGDLCSNSLPLRLFFVHTQHANHNTHVHIQHICCTKSLCHDHHDIWLSQKRDIPIWSSWPSKIKVKKYKCYVYNMFAIIVPSEWHHVVWFGSFSLASPSCKCYNNCLQTAQYHSNMYKQYNYWL